MPERAPDPKELAETIRKGCERQAERRKALQAFGETGWLGGPDSFYRHIECYNLTVQYADGLYSLIVSTYDESQAFRFDSADEVNKYVEEIEGQLAHS